jgi:hypothetical protein
MCLSIKRPRYFTTSAAGNGILLSERGGQELFLRVKVILCDFWGLILISHLVNHCSMEVR